MMDIKIYPANTECPACHRPAASRVLAYYEGTCGCVSGDMGSAVPVWRIGETCPCVCNPATGQRCAYHQLIEGAVPC